MIDQTNPKALFKLGRYSPHINNGLDAWLRGDVDWETCLSGIAEEQSRVINRYIEKYDVPDLQGKLDIIKVKGSGNPLEKQADMISVIVLGDEILSKLMAYAIDVENHKTPEIMVSKDINVSGIENGYNDKGCDRGPRSKRV